MKKIYSFFSIVLLSASLMNGQGVLELNALGAISYDKGFPLIGGGGAEIGIYSPPWNIIKSGGTKRKPVASKLCARFGGNFFLSGMGNKKFDHVPLLPPEEGDAKVCFSNALYAANFSGRISSSVFKGKVLPYVQGDIGYRRLYSDLSIAPHDVKKESTYLDLEKADGLNVAGTAGLLIKAGTIYINTGVTYTHSDPSGSFVDLRSLNRIGDNIEYTRRASAKDFLVFKLGITIYLGEGGGGGSSSGGHSSSCNTGWLDGLFSGCGGGNSAIGLIIH